MIHAMVRWTALAVGLLTTNPPALESFMRDLVNAAGAEMAREGIIAR